MWEDSGFSYYKFYYFVIITNMKILKTFVCILALSAYAGCVLNTSQPATLSYISSSQQLGVAPTQQGQVTQQGAAQSQESTQPQQLPMKDLSVDTPDGPVAFRVQVADTEPTRATGLMFRTEMPVSEGMIFLFEKQQSLTFWMKNTLIPLDMVFFDQNWKIVSIQKNAEPCKADPCGLYPSSGPAKYVLEINGGLSDKLGILQGAKAQLQ